MLEYLSSDYPLEQGYFYVVQISANLIGLWPAKERTVRSITLAFLCFGFCFYGTVGEALYGVVHLQDMTKGLEGITSAASKCVCSIKIYWFFVNSKRFDKIVRKMRQMLLRAGEYI